MADKFLLSLSLGPVGGFIAAGRRSRDLWWGSAWLSEVTAHVAQQLGQVSGVTVILPTAGRKKTPAGRSRHAGRVANKILAWVAPPADPRRLAEQAREDANAWLADRIEGALAVDKVKPLVDSKRAGPQIEAIRSGDFIELRAGWSVERAAKGELSSFQATVEAATNLRDASPRLFREPASSEGVPKCHLDPGRDSVLRDDADKAARRRAGLLDGEQLDVLYLARRVSLFLGEDGKPLPRPNLGALPFPPVGWAACEPWLEGVKDRRELRTLTELLKSRSDHDDFFAWCSPVEPPKSGVQFAFDPSFLFEGALGALQKEAGRDRIQLPTELNGPVRSLHAAAGPPIPYYALVEMDGDGVGAALKRIDDEVRWTKVVNELYTFSDDAARVIEEGAGTAFYAAADELMFYAPVDRALEIVNALQSRWSEAVADLPLERTSLSAGVVFVHVKDDLDRARKAAGKALKAAKDARRKADCSQPWLCVQEQPRAGDGRSLIGRADRLLGDLERWVQATQKGSDAEISLRTAHILADHVERLAPGYALGDEQARARLDPALLLEVTRVARGAILRQLKASDKEPDEDDPPRPQGPRERLRARVRGATQIDDLIQLQTELLIAARIGRIKAQRVPREDDR